MTATLRGSRLLAVVACATVALVGCSSPPAPEKDSETVVTTVGPQRIAAVSPDVAETVAALGAGERLVLVPDSQTNPVMTNHLPVMQSVSATVAAHGAADPEQILASGPDIAIITPRHEGESDTAALLEASAVPVLTLPNAWQSGAEMLGNIALIGDAIGAPDRGAELAREIADALDAVEPVSGPAPSVLVLSNQAGRPMINAGRGFALDLLARAGGRNAADDAGMTRMTFVDPEQVAGIDPDAILLVDIRGAGEESFAAVLGNPAVAGLSAVRQERILLLDGKHTQAYGLRSVPEGLAQLRDWLAGLVP